MMTSKHVKFVNIIMSFIGFVQKLLNMEANTWHVCVMGRIAYTEATSKWSSDAKQQQHWQVHRSPTATTRPRPRAAHRGSCPTDRPGAVAIARSRPLAARKGPCPADRPRAAATAGPQSRAARRGLCPTNRPRAATIVGPQPQVAR